jgi:hypothetical protein
MSLITPVCVYLAMNPDAELTTEVISARWGTDQNNVTSSLRHAETKGWVKSTLKQNPMRVSKKIRVYTAGPRLLKEIGR